MMNDRCGKPCPPAQRICRREFLKIAAATGLLVACSPRQRSVSPPANTSAPTAAPTEESLTSKYVAYCGYDCTEDPKYPATCAGCLASNDQQLPSGTLACEVRTCNMERGVANCGHCEAYPCDKLEDMFSEWIAGRWAEAAREAKAVLHEESNAKRQP